MTPATGFLGAWLVGVLLGVSLLAAWLVLAGQEPQAQTSALGRALYWLGLGTLWLGVALAGLVGLLAVGSAVLLLLRPAGAFL